MNLLTKKISKDSLFSEYTNILNGVLQLSNRESEVFSFLLLKDSSNINSRDIRKEIIKKFNISEANLSRYLRTIKDKGLIIKSEAGKWVINDIIRPVLVNGKFELKFVLEVI